METKHQSGSYTDKVYRMRHLIDYAQALGKTGLDSKQLYSRHARVCNEIEKELGIDAE